MNNELYHHGILGQKWGIQNGPPYPLGSDKSTGHRLRIKRRTKKPNNTAPEHKSLSNEDLDTLTDRYRREQKYLDAVADYYNSMHKFDRKHIGRDVVKEILGNPGKRVLSGVVDTAMVEAVNAIAEGLGYSNGKFVNKKKEK